MFNVETELLYAPKSAGRTANTCGFDKQWTRQNAERRVARLEDELCTVAYLARAQNFQIMSRSF